MDKNLSFFSRYFKALKFSPATRENTILIVKRLLKYDYLKKTQFEVSFKIKKNKILNSVRFLNMDADVYSCKNKLLFLARLKACLDCVEKQVSQEHLNKAVLSLMNLADSPMDLYFGADVKDEDLVYAFWLIFGGVEKSGKVNFCPYNLNKLVFDILKIIKFKSPGKLKKDILNFGFDIDKNQMYYKLYYLCNRSNIAGSSLKNLSGRVDRRLKGFKYFSFFSEMYNKTGSCIKKKLFVEFLDTITADSKTFNELLMGILLISRSSYSPEKLANIFKGIKGRISLVSFEPDGTLTFYIRPVV